jgi:hypothetical protein
MMTSLAGVCIPMSAVAAQPNAAIAAQYLRSPIRFEVNKGQAPKGVDYISFGARHSLYLQKTGVRLDVPGEGKPESVVLRYVKADPTGSKAVDQIGRTSYLIDSDPHHWFLGVPSYKKVRYDQVWKGIDVVYYGNNSQFEYDLVVAAGADLGQAAFEVTGAKGLQVSSNGDLLMHTPSGNLVQRRPIAYQQTRQGRREVDAKYAVSGNTVSFRIADYDHSSELVIDPSIAYSLPRIFSQQSSFGTEGTGVVVDSSGNAYVVGNTVPFLENQTTKAVYTGVFANQINIAGQETSEQILFGATDGNTMATSVATDNGGSVFVTGGTASVNQFPLKNAYQSTSAGGVDAYLIRLNFNNISSPLLYSSYLGGSGNDQGNGIAVDSLGNAYVAGETDSSNFPATMGNIFGGGGNDGFLTKINTNGSGAASLVYSFYLGGSGNDFATSVAADTSGFVYVAGSTQSTNFAPSPGFGFATSNPSGNPNGFLVKLNDSTGAAAYTTFVTGGPVSAVAADGNQQAYVTGETNGVIPTNSVNQGYSTVGGASHVFMARFSTTVNGAGSLIYSTYLGGGGQEAGYGIAVDEFGNASVVGVTTSSNFPVAGSPLQSGLNGTEDAFVSKINTNASMSASLVYSSFLGGSGVDFATAVGITPGGNPVITGQTSSPNFPVSPGASLDGGTDPRAFVTKIYYENPPFGSLDTPVSGSTNLAGGVGVTGWALSSIGIGSIGIWRDPVTGETPSSNGLVFVDNADRVDGSRPDVAAAYPGYPQNNWGWGLQVLTNELPGNNGMALGNGTYTFHALAVDIDGETADIGQTTVSVNNAGSVLPFGTIDTPTQGGTESGTFVNFGWALTPEPATIPIDGSTILVYIDNVFVGHPVYNNPRPDIQMLFPGYNNTNGAVGYFYIDTTQYSNGQHQISWTVTDNEGHANGLGSRFFTILN